MKQNVEDLIEKINLINRKYITEEITSKKKEELISAAKTIFALRMRKETKIKIDNILQTANSKNQLKAMLYDSFSF